MANSGPATNGSQFFVISGPDGVRLPPQYSLFGQLVSGRDVLAAIDKLGSGSGAPREKVVIESVTITEAD
jgi:cyclophilin family peptidyl-prolyl cis-trans isomerase